MEVATIKKVAEFKGFLVYNDGRICGPRGNLVKINNNTGNIMYYDTEIKNGKKETIRKGMLAGKFVYMALTGEKLTNRDIVMFKDGNKTNVEISNIVIQRRETYAKKNNWTQKRKYADIAPTIRKEYNYEERKKHHFAKEFAHPTIEELSKKYNIGKTTIQKIIKGTY